MPNQLSPSTSTTNTKKITTETAQSLQLHTLPAPIQGTVFSHLRLCDLAPLARVNKTLYRTLTQPNHDAALSFAHQHVKQDPNLPQYFSVIDLAAYEHIASPRIQIMQSDQNEFQKKSALITAYSTTRTSINRSILLHETDTILQLPFGFTPDKAAILGSFLKHHAAQIKREILPTIRQKILQHLEDYGKSEALKALYDATQPILNLDILRDETNAILNTDIQDQLFIARPLEKLYETGKALLDEPTTKSLIWATLNSPIKCDYYKEIIISASLNTENNRLSAAFIADMTKLVKNRICYEPNKEPDSWA